MTSYLHVWNDVGQLEKTLERAVISNANDVVIGSVSRTSLC